MPFDFILQYLAVRSGVERKFQVSSIVIYSVPRLLVVAVNVSKPTDTPAYDLLQITAVLVKQHVIRLDRKAIRMTIELSSTTIRNAPLHLQHLQQPKGCSVVHWGTLLMASRS